MGWRTNLAKKYATKAKKIGVSAFKTGKSILNAMPTLNEDALGIKEPSKPRVQNPKRHVKSQTVIIINGSRKASKKKKKQTSYLDQLL